MEYLIYGMLAACVVIAGAELFLAYGEYGGKKMANVFLLLLGFTSVTTVYEIAKTGKRTKSDKVNRAVDSWKKGK